MEKDLNRGAAGQKSREGGQSDPHKNDPNKARPAAIERYLEGVNFPSNKADLMAKAKENNAPSDVMSILSRFNDDGTFHSMSDISKQVGRAE